MSQTYNDRRTAARRRDEEPPARANVQGWIALALFVAFLLFCGYIVATRYLDTPPAAPQPTARPAIIAPASNPYLNNVGQQAPHVPRSEPTPIPQPAAPEPQPVAAPAVVDVAPAAPLPTLAPAQAAVIEARGSGTCPAGQVFYARSGCHTPGSGGAMPGPVGAK